MKLTETYKTIIAEQKWYEAVKDSLTIAASPVIGSVVLLKKAMQLYRGPKFEKIRLIFPLADWEVAAVTFLQKLGIVTGVYTSLADAKKYVAELVKSGAKPKEIVIGSHGPKGGDSLLTTRSGEEFYFDNSFLTSFKPLVQPDTKVFFTACYGADSLLGLKDAAEKLGTTVYGASGVYNYVTNTAQKGFYWCSAKNYESAETENTYESYKLDDEWNGSIRNVTLPFETDQVSVKVTVKDGTFPVNVPSFNARVSELLYLDIGRSAYDGGRNTGTRFDIEYLDSDILKVPGLYDAFTSKMKSKGLTMNASDFFEGYVMRKIKSGDIKLTITSARAGSIDLLSLKPIANPKDVDNEYLLKNKLCGKMNKAPISWL
jgi:hypothetical protein